ncbi:Type i inositol polyphosphate 5-phosphatase [Thalictrum thalictroides]|uniref:Type i inositol polyphosphate 5-phosphatase n=1 Tax=Thalictrum thalictroides TaxID=46969 RepID=A0A7J6WI83_THATH|nr:Type i inositol polyphosphate 5-phosphatase [Thalictrum thalictroides]
MFLRHMDNKEKKSRRKSLKNWLRRKHKGPELFNLLDGEEDECYDSDNNLFQLPELEKDSCFVPNELRIFVGTWNVAGRSPVGSLAEDLEDWLNLKDAADIYVLGFQEIVPLKTLNVLGAEDLTPATKWNTLIGETLNYKSGSPWLAPILKANSRHDHDNLEIRVSASQIESPMRDQPKHQVEDQDDSSTYKLMASKKMVGVFVSIWMKKELVRKYCISNVKACSVACGIMGYLGNKGSVAVSMSIEGTSFCFIAAHLASGEKNGDEVRRNYQVSEIFRRTSFPRLREDDDNPHPLTILGHDRIFWFGDLNYRLYLEDNLARMLIKTKDWKALQEFDQLKKEQDYGGVFEGWREGSMEFAPTYKYSTSNSNRYSGGLPAKSGEKQRTPAWCDRILWYGKCVQQLSYFRSESKFSDHRPVSALFCTQIEVLNPGNRIVAKFPPNILPALLPRDNQSGGGKDEEDRETKHTLLSLLVQDIELSSSSLDQNNATITNNH